MPAATGNLLTAARNGDLDKVRSLINSGANVNQRDSSSRTPLMHAAENSHPDIVRCLLEAGANVDLRQGQQKTALHMAAESLGSRSEDCVALLLEAGARIDITDSLMNTPLLLVLKRDSKYSNNSSFQIMKRFIDAHCTLDCCDTERRTPLHYACYKAIGTELLLSSGASPNAQDEDGNSPLHMAAIEGFDNVVHCLTTFNCNPNLINHSGKMPIHYLSMKGHTKAVDNLIQCGAYLDHLDKDGKTPLWYAVNHNHILVVDSLLRGNCCPDYSTVIDSKTEHTQMSPLAVALKYKYYGIARRLVLAGCCLAPLREVINLRETSRSEREAMMNQSPMMRDLMLANQPPESPEELEAMEWFSEWLNGPQTLKQLCRVRIRECIRPKVVNKVLLELSVHLPVALQDFINLRELEDLPK